MSKRGAKRRAKTLNNSGFWWTIMDKENRWRGLWSHISEVRGGDGGELNSGERPF
jgi:hypothetical protein